MGVVALVGPQNATVFFFKKSKIMGSAFYFAGFALICLGWFLCTFAGFCLQLYGLYLLFRSFLKTIFSWMQTLPYIGPLLQNNQSAHKIVDFLSEGHTNSGAYAKKFEV